MKKAAKKPAKKVTSKKTAGKAPKKAVKKAAAKKPAVKSAAKKFDVAIVGGGPGGSTLAALLIKQGRSVCIVERQEFPRFRIGESLLPFSIDIWRKTGVLDRIHANGYLVKRGARFVIDETLEEECFWFKNGLDKDHPYAFQVQRAPFDKLLLEHAKAMGATVYQPASAHDFRAEKDRAVLSTSVGDIEAAIVADVSGRWTFMSSKTHQRNVHPSHKKVAVFAHFKNVVRCEQDPSNIIIVRYGETKKGWFWLIPFSDGTTSVGVVADAEFFKGSGLTPEAFFEKSVRESRSMGPRMAKAARCCDIMMEADFSYTSEKHADDRLIKVGDAGAFIDPIFSSGVFLSTKAAELAAIAIDNAFKKKDFSRKMFVDYERKIKHGTKVFWSFIDAFYNKEFLQKMVQSRRRPLLQSSITSLLAGDVFNEKNALIDFLMGEKDPNQDAEIAALVG